MNISQRGLDLIKSFEGFSATRYLDSVGVPTIGYGTTAAVVNPVPATCTREQAEQWLRISIERSYAPAVNAVIAAGCPLNQNQFDALVSFCYNLGPGAVAAGSTMGQDLRARNYAKASADFMIYVNAGGRPLQGLINRRTAERKLFDTPVSAEPPKEPKPEPKPDLPLGEIMAIAYGKSKSIEHVFQVSIPGYLFHKYCYVNKPNEWHNQNLCQTVWPNVQLSAFIPFVPSLEVLSHDDRVELLCEVKDPNVVRKFVFADAGGTPGAQDLP